MSDIRPTREERDTIAAAGPKARQAQIDSKLAILQASLQSMPVRQFCVQQTVELFKAYPEVSGEQLEKTLRLFYRFMSEGPNEPAG